MMKPCIICYKLCGNISNLSETEESGSPEALQKFFSLLGRHLHHEEPKDDVNGKVSQESLFRNLTNADLPACEDCSALAESFCELYHEMKSIELLLNFKLTELNNAMRGGQRSSSRLAEFRSRASQLMNGVTFKDIVQSNRRLVKICEQKLITSSTFPKVVLQRQDAMIEEVLKNTAGSKLVDPSMTSDGTGNEKSDDVARPTNNKNCTLIVIRRAGKEEQLGNDFQQNKTCKVTPVHQSSQSMSRKIKTESNCDTTNHNGMEKNCDWTESPPAPPTKVVRSTPKLGAVHRCAKCKKTFSFSVKLTEHECPGQDQEKAISSDGNESKSERDYTNDGINDVVAKVPSSGRRELKKKTVIDVVRNVPRRPRGRIDPDTEKIICIICKLQFSTQPGFHLHWKSIHLRQRHSCTLCDKTFSQQCGLKYHHNTHTRTGRVSCPTCSKTFATKQYLAIHQGNSHSGNGNKETSKSADSEHRRPKRKYNVRPTKIPLIINPINGKQMCSLCRKEFASRQGLVIHHKTSHLRIRNNCTLCGKTFTQAHAYRRHHRNIHKGVPFPRQEPKCKKSISAKERAGETTAE